MKTKLSLFFIIGFFIYLIDIALNSSDNPKEIYISDQEVLSLVSAWESQVGRKPTEDEITRIINNLIEEQREPIFFKRSGGNIRNRVRSNIRFI